MCGGSITIDGVKISFSVGETIMEAALEAGIYIPHLCHHPEFQPHGSCKLCTVLVNGRSCSACTMPAMEGQDVLSNTAELNAARLRITQMLFVEGNHVCPGCEKSGDCQLQGVGYYLGMEDTHYPHFFPSRRVDASHADLMLDLDRCILCELCVRASRDVDRKDVFAVVGRGLDSRLIVNAPSGRLADTKIALEDRAAHICPVGAILIKRTAFRIPIGQRPFDQGDIADVQREEGSGGSANG